MVLTGTLDLGRYSVACGRVGILQACLDACVAYAARAPAVGGSPLRELPADPAKLTDMVDRRRARPGCCVAEAGRLKDAGDAGDHHGDLGGEVLRLHRRRAPPPTRCRSTAPTGAARTTRSARYFRDAKVMEIIEGSNEIQQITIPPARPRE